MKKVFTLLLPIVFISLLGWYTYLYTKNKDNLAINVSYINSYVKNKLLKIFPDSQISIHRTKLIWQKSDEKSYLLLEGITIDSQDISVDIPKIFLFSKTGLAFLFDSSNTTLVSVIDPYILLNKKHDNKSANFVAQARALLTNIPFWMEIKVSRLTIERKLIGKLSINELMMDKLKERNTSTINLIIDNGSEDDMLISLHASEDSGHSISALAEFSHLNISSLLGSIVPTISGKFSICVDKKNKITDGQLNIWKAKGAIKLHSDLDPVNLNSANLKLRYTQNVIDMQSLHIWLDQTNLSLNGKVNTETEWTSLKAQINGLSAKNLCSYFPASMNFKSWYCNHVIKGEILDTSIKLETTISNIMSGHVLNDIDLNANIKDVTVKFHEDFEPINHLDGNISIQNNNLEVIVDRAQFQGFTINNGNIEINNLDVNDQKISIYGNASSDAYELFELLRIKEIVKIKKGDVEGEAKSEFNFNIDIDNLTANLTSRIDNLSISSDFYNISISDYSINLNFNDNLDINFKSYGLMHNKPMRLNINGNYNANNKLNCEFLGDISSQNIKKLAEWVEVDGYMNLHLESRYDKHLIIEGKADLLELGLNISSLGWNSELEDHNIIDFTVEIKDKDDVLLRNIHAYGENLDIELSGRVSSSLYLDFSKLKLQNNNLKLQAQFNNDQNTLNISGESIDLSNFSNSFGNSDKLYNTKITMDVDKMIMKNSVLINNAYLDFSYIKGNDYSGKFLGSLQDGNDIVAEYSKIGLELYADNAGLFLKALNIANTVEGGKLSFYLSTQSEENKTAYGMVSLSDFYIVRTPILAKMLALSSLQGIVNTLNNDGIYFYEFDVPFSYDGGVIDIEESWLEGSELGISVVGRANLVDQTFSIKGQIIPAYALNKSIWKIPLIGKILTGGKSRGVMAVDYRIKGSEQKNDVSVDLVSVLTPNILKRVLEVFSYSYK